MKLLCFALQLTLVKWQFVDCLLRLAFKFYALLKNLLVLHTGTPQIHPQIQFLKLDVECSLVIDSQPIEGVPCLSLRISWDRLQLLTTVNWMLGKK